jgi:hypothetical protein
LEPEDLLTTQERMQLQLAKIARIKALEWKPTLLSQRFEDGAIEV